MSRQWKYMNNTSYRNVWRTYIAIRIKTFSMPFGFELIHFLAELLNERQLSQMSVFWQICVQQKHPYISGSTNTKTDDNCSFYQLHFHSGQLSRQQGLFGLILGGPPSLNRTHRVVWLLVSLRWRMGLQPASVTLKRNWVDFYSRNWTLPPWFLLCPSRHWEKVWNLSFCCLSS